MDFKSQFMDIKIEKSDGNFSDSCKLGSKYYQLNDVDKDLSDVLFPADIADLDFDLLPDLPCDLMLDPILGEDLNLRDDSTSNSSDVSPSDVYYSNCSSSVDSPPLTPPSPQSPTSPLDHMKMESETNNNVCLGGLPKLLPALKSSRGRSASHDSPDVQALKRHIRMIRNRESASLSRKKKKEYVTQLEGRVKELEQENTQLRRENIALKSKLNNRLPAPSNGKSKIVPGMAAKIVLLGLCCFVFVSYNGSQEPISTRDPSLPPSKHFIDVIDDVSRKGNYTFTHGRNRIARSLKFRAEVEENPKLENISTAKSYPNSFSDLLDKNALKNVTQSISKCPIYFNETESLKVQNKLKGIFSPNLKKKKKTKNAGILKPFIYSMIEASKEDKGLTVYDEKMRRYSRILDKIQRRKDTFYVVSLAVENQLLLTAKAPNASTRPKMSFLMPWINETLGGKEEMMQIDCEVTQVFNLNPRRRRN